MTHASLHETRKKFVYLGFALTDLIETTDRQSDCRITADVRFDLLPSGGIQLFHALLMNLLYCYILRPNFILAGDQASQESV